MQTETQTYRCECGAVTGEPCEWTGPLSEMVVLEYMPEHLRVSHEAAGNSGIYPHNGATRIAIEKSCVNYAGSIWEDGERVGPDPWTEVIPGDADFVRQYAEEA